MPSRTAAQQGSFPLQVRLTAQLPSSLRLSAFYLSLLDVVPLFTHWVISEHLLLVIVPERRAPRGMGPNYPGTLNSGQRRRETSKPQ